MNQIIENTLSTDITDLVLVVSGEVVESNFSQVADQINYQISQISEDLKTEQDFKDAADIAQAPIDAARDAELARISEAASKIPKGVAGDCDLCGEWSGRLVRGACCPCRDKHGLG